MERRKRKKRKKKKGKRKVVAEVELDRGDNGQRLDNESEIEREDQLNLQPKLEDNVVHINEPKLIFKTFLVIKCENL